MSFICFILICWGLCFLIADASLFGCDASSYPTEPNDPQYKDALKEAQQKGILKLRQKFLVFKFFRLQFKCYFCLGIWCGPATHLLLADVWGTSYWFAFGAPSWYKIIFISSLVGAVSSYTFDKILGTLENLSHKPQLFL